MTAIIFFIPMIPPTTTHQQKAVRVVKGKPVFYEPPELKDARAKLLAHLSKYAPAEPYTGPVRLYTLWYFPVTGNHKDNEYKATRPDTDNLQKLLKDVMTELHYWRDDALVVSEYIEKRYSEYPGLHVIIDPI